MLVQLLRDTSEEPIRAGLSGLAADAGSSDRPVEQTIQWALNKAWGYPVFHTPFAYFLKNETLLAMTRSGINKLRVDGFETV
jgi:hypothetical protein